MTKQTSWPGVGRASRFGGESLDFEGHEGNGDPDADLGKTDRANADHLAGHHLGRADFGQHDFKDARGLFFNDGPRDIHPIEEDDEVHEEEEPVGADESGIGVLAVLRGRFELDRLEEVVDLGGAHALLGEGFAREDSADGVGYAGFGDDVGLRFRVPLVGAARLAREQEA